MSKTRRLAAAVALMLMAAAVTYTICRIGFERSFEKELAFYEKYRVIAEMDGLIDEYFIADHDSGSLVEGAADGMVAALGDRWSYYMTAQELEEYLRLSENRYTGIGVTVTKEEGGGLLVQSVAEASPAQRAGIEPGDTIVAVGENDLTGMSLEQAKELIGSMLGKLLELTVVDAEGKSRVLSVNCEVIETPPVSWTLEESVGVIRIENFEQGSAELFRKAVNELRAQGAKALLFDLRFNPGGRLSQLTTMLDMLLPEGEIFISEDKLGQTSITRSDPACVSMPMAVLVNEDTYSAAEYFAAVLQEYDWAQVVGMPTTGKGYSQVTFYLSEGALHISTGAYYTPGGISLAETGLAPDVQVALDSEEEYIALYSGTLDNAADEQYAAAIELLSAQIEQK